MRCWDVLLGKVLREGYVERWPSCPLPFALLLHCPHYHYKEEVCVRCGGADNHTTEFNIMNIYALASLTMSVGAKPHRSSCKPTRTLTIIPHKPVVKNVPCPLPRERVEVKVRVYPDRERHAWHIFGCDIVQW